MDRLVIDGKHKCFSSLTCFDVFIVLTPLGIILHAYIMPSFCYPLVGMKMKQKVSLAILALVWATSVIFWPRRTNISFSPNDEQKHSSADLYQSPLTEANFGLLGVDFYETSEGRKHWHIKSKFAELHRKENYAFMQSVKGDFFSEKTGNVIKTESEYGRSHVDKRVIELEGNVAIRSAQGYLFEMEKLTYDGRSKQFHTNDLIRVKGPNVHHPTLMLKGRGLTGSLEREHFRLERGVTAQKQLNQKADWLKVNSQTGEFFSAEQRAIFNGKVKTSLPKMVIDSDSLELGMSAKKESLKANGNVVLKLKDKLAKAEQLSVDFSTNKIVMQGNAKVEAKDNQIVGKKIVLYTDDDRVEVEGAEGQVKN